MMVVNQDVLDNLHRMNFQWQDNDNLFHPLISFRKCCDIVRLGCKHTERQAARQASAASEASYLCNGSGTHLECQGKYHHRLPLVMLPLHLPLVLDAPLDAPLDARCGYAFTFASSLPSPTFRGCKNWNKQGEIQNAEEDKMNSFRFKLRTSTIIHFVSYYSVFETRYYLTNGSFFSREWFDRRVSQFCYIRNI